MKRLSLYLLALLPLLAACTPGADTKVPAASADGGAPATTAPPRVIAPLTGNLVDPDAIDHSVVSIKVDNSPQARPQAGLDKADVIFEEKVEGGVTRFIAVYHSQESDLVGPIRSLRTSDPAIVSALGGVFVFSDGVAKSLSRLKGAPVSTVTERDGASAFTYPKGKRRPWATFGATERLREAGDDDAQSEEPPALFSYVENGGSFSAANATPALKATVAFGGLTAATLDWDAAGGRWLRSTNGTPHLLADGSRLGFTNVIIQVVPYQNVGYNDSSGHKVDEAVVVGSGEAIALVGGQQVKLRWSKSSPTAVTTYTDLSGAPLRLLAGNTLVMLPPKGGSIKITAPTATAAA